jgi:hypothetical protein
LPWAKGASNPSTERRHERDLPVLLVLSGARDAERIGDEGLLRVEALGREIRIGLQMNGSDPYKTRYDVRIWGSDVRPRHSDGLFGSPSKAYFSINR